VSRSIVNYNDLKLPRALGQCAGDGGPHVVLTIVHRHQYRGPHDAPPKRIGTKADHPGLEAILMDARLKDERRRRWPSPVMDIGYHSDACSAMIARQLSPGDRSAPADPRVHL